MEARRARSPEHVPGDGAIPTLGIDRLLCPHRVRRIEGTDAAGTGHVVKQPSVGRNTTAIEMP